MQAVHPIFHVSMLEPVTLNTIPNHVIPPPPPVEIDREFEHEVSKVLDSKIDKCHTCKLLYPVQWSGYEGTDEEMSWLPATELEHASKAVSDFHHAYLNKPGPLNLLFLNSVSHRYPEQSLFLAFTYISLLYNSISLLRILQNKNS